MQETNPSAFANSEVAHTTAQKHSPTRVLFRHEPRPHPNTPQKITIKKAEQALTGFNMKLAVVITKGLGTMICAYIFAILAIIGFPGLHATPTQYVQWVSQTFIQLVALSVLAVGQQVLSKQSELMAEEQYHTTMNSYHDIKQIMQHLYAQDTELLRQAKMLMHLLEKNGISIQQLESEVGKPSQLEAYTERLSTNAPTNSAPTEGEQGGT